MVGHIRNIVKPLINQKNAVLTKNNILFLQTSTAAIPVGTIGVALGGMRIAHCTLHFSPCCCTSPGISSSRMICTKSLSTLYGTFSMHPKPSKLLGLYGGAAARVSKNFSMIWSSSNVHWSLCSGRGVTLMCRDWRCWGFSSTRHWRVSTLKWTTPGSLLGIAVS